MRKVLCASLLVLFSTLSYSQNDTGSIWIGCNMYSQVTNLKFITSDGTSLGYNNQLNFGQGIGLAYQYHEFLLDMNVDYYRVSARLQDGSFNSAIMLGYFQPSVNASLVLSSGRFPLKPRIGAGFGYATLIDGSQQTQNTTIDLKESDAIKTSDFGVNLNLGIMAVNSSRVAVSCLYNFRVGLSNIENPADNQTTNTRIHALQVKIQVGF